MPFCTNLALFFALHILDLGEKYIKKYLFDMAFLPDFDRLFAVFFLLFGKMTGE